MKKQHHKLTYLICLIFLLIGVVGVLIVNPSTYQLTSPVVVKSSLYIEDFQYQTPENEGEDNALNELIRSENELQLISGYGVNTRLLNDTLLRAKKSFVGEDSSLLEKKVEGGEDIAKEYYLKTVLESVEQMPEYEREERNLTDVFVLTQFITFKKLQALAIMDALVLIEEKEQQYLDSGIDVSEATGFIVKSRESFEEERYEESENHLSEADTRLDKAYLEKRREQELVKLNQNPFIKYWRHLLLILLGLTILTPPVIHKTYHNVTRRKLHKMRIEMQILKKLLTSTQEDYFKKRSIPKKTYEIRVDLYKRKINDLARTMSMLESVLYGIEQKKDAEIERLKRVKSVLRIKR